MNGVSTAIQSPILFLVRPPRVTESDSQSAIGNRTTEEAVRRGWEIRGQLRSQRILSAASETRGRPRFVLTPQDLETVYRNAHLYPVVVLAAPPLSIRLDPRNDPATNRSLISIDDLLRYKACGRLVNSVPEVPQAFDEAVTILSHVTCVDHRDPRVLPLHVFCPRNSELNLGDETGRKRFEAKFFGPRIRRDPEGRTWALGGPRHGQRWRENETETLRVGPIELPKGHHWDVGSAVNGSGLSNGWEVWKIQANGYLNVGPDAGIRDGLNCKRIWKR